MNRLALLSEMVACAPKWLRRALEAQRRRPAMNNGAIDLHKKESQIRIMTEKGEMLDRRIVTTRERFSATCSWGRERMRILLEASTESEWVAQHLETLGHEVIVADPNYAPMYAQRSRRMKTDRRDVAAQTEACQLRDLWSGASKICATTRCAIETECARGIGTDSADAGDLTGPRDHASRRVLYPQRPNRDVS